MADNNNNNTKVLYSRLRAAWKSPLKTRKVHLQFFLELLKNRPEELLFWHLWFEKPILAHRPHRICHIIFYYSLAWNSENELTQKCHQCLICGLTNLLSTTPIYLRVWISLIQQYLWAQNQPNSKSVEFKNGTWQELFDQKSWSPKIAIDCKWSTKVVW